MTLATKFRAGVDATVRRASRFVLRDSARVMGLQPLERVSACGSPVGARVSLIRAADGGHIGGVSMCASVHSCPTCAPVIRQARAVQLAEAITRWIEGGGRVYFVTLTASHHEGHSLGSTLDALGKAWHTVMSGRSRVELDAALGSLRSTAGDGHPVAGHVRAIDITHGVNGWHPHYHCVFFVGSWVGPSAIHKHVVAPWQHGVGRAGRGSVTEACHIKEVLLDVAGAAFGLAAYVMDVSTAALEVTRIDTKQAGVGFSPWQLLCSAVAGDWDSARLWSDYSTVMRGRRSSVWSRGLLAWFGEPESTDQELADSVVLESKEVLGHISNRDYMTLRRHPGATAALLISIEAGSWQSYLRSMGCTWELDDPAGSA